MGPRIDRDNGGADAQVLAGIGMVGFGVECGVCPGPIPLHRQGRLGQNRSKLRGIVTGTGTQRGTGDEMTVSIHGCGQLGPRSGGLGARRSVEEVRQGVTTLQACGINGRSWKILD